MKRSTPRTPSARAALHAKQAREAAHIESFVRRFRAQASKARQVQSRLKWLARLGELATVHTDADFEWEFAAPRKLPRPLVTLREAERRLCARGACCTEVSTESEPR